MKSSVKFLVLLDAARRALLFDGERRLVGEVIEDDGFIVQRLLMNAQACALPLAELLSSLVPNRTPTCTVHCFELY